MSLSPLKSSVQIAVPVSFTGRGGGGGGGGGFLLSDIATPSALHVIVIGMLRVASKNLDIIRISHRQNDLADDVHIPFHVPPLVCGAAMCARPWLLRTA